MEREKGKSNMKERKGKEKTGKESTYLSQSSQEASTKRKLTPQSSLRFAKKTPCAVKQRHSKGTEAKTQYMMTMSISIYRTM